MSLPLSQSQDDDGVRLRWKSNGKKGKYFQLTAGADPRTSILTEENKMYSLLPLGMQWPVES